MNPLPSSGIRLMYHLACTLGIVNSNGCLDTSLFRLTTKAKQGGRGGYAFSIAENGSTVHDGYLLRDSDGLPAAYPYWNIYCNKSPAIWELPGMATEYVKCRLRYALDNTGAYRYRCALDYFLGHDLTAEAPESWNATVTLTVGSATNPDIMTHFWLGDFDWSRISGVTRCKLQVFDGSLVHAESDLKPISRNVQINAPIHGFYINTSYENAKSYVTKIALCSSDGNEMGLLPCSGEFSIKVQNKPKHTIQVTVNGNPRVFTIGEVSESDNDLSALGTHKLTDIDVRGKLLERINWEAISTSTGETVQSETVLPSAFTFWDQPTELTASSSDRTEQFRIDKNHLPVVPGTVFSIVFVYT